MAGYGACRLLRRVASSRRQAHGQREGEVSDLVQRLRGFAGPMDARLCAEAAAEIERLQHVADAEAAMHNITANELRGCHDELHKLRAALEKIATYEEDLDDHGHGEVVIIARGVLTETARSAVADDDDNDDPEYGEEPDVHSW